MNIRLKDFFSFRRMIAPVIIQVLFWLGILACLITVIVDIKDGHFLNALLVFILGPLIVRIGCELLILFFRINETLTDIKNQR